MNFEHMDRSSPAENAARVLEADPGYRVLRRLPRPEEIFLPVITEQADLMTMGVIDCETTGLDPERHEMIELAVSRVTLDRASGQIVEIEPMLSWLNQPAEKLPDDIVRLTGITDADLVGEQFDEAAVAAAFAGVACVIAHNAGFDRSFVTRRFPALADLPWACSLREVDWAGGGLGGRSIAALLTDSGHFVANAHRAASDVWSTICLLYLPDRSGRSFAAQLVETASRKTVRLFARGAPFAVKDALKAAGYRWDVARKAWWIEGGPAFIAAQERWLATLSPVIAPFSEPITWLNRHA